MSAADAFAIAMLGIITLTLGLIAWMLFFMLRSGAKRDKDQVAVDKLLEEVNAMVKGKEPPEKTAQKQPSTPPPQEQTSSSPWQREGDWWKDE